MPFAKFICAALLGSIANTALACVLPSLVEIPEKVGGQEAQLRAAAGQYFQSMQAYTQCVQAELTAAGGDTAAPIVRAVLVKRNNSAVSEAQAVLKQFTENVGPIEGAPPVAAK